MSAILNKSLNERAVLWAALTENSRRVACLLHEMALGEKPTENRGVGPIYVRQAHRMQLEGITLTKLAGPPRH